MGSEDEVRDGGSAKLSFCFLNERGSPTTTTWGGGTLGGVGGRKSRVGQLTINKICTDEAVYINAFFTRLQREGVSSILAMSTRPAPCGSPAATIASAMRCSLANPGVQTWVTRPWRSFGTRHGGARGRWRRGNLPSPLEEKTTRRVEPNFAPPQLGVFSRRK